MISKLDRLCLAVAHTCSGIGTTPSVTVDILRPDLGAMGGLQVLDIICTDVMSSQNKGKYFETLNIPLKGTPIACEARRKS